MGFRALLFIVTAGLAFAGESAVLANGGRLHADRHEAVGAKVRLYSGPGYVELDAAQVLRFEAEEAPSGNIPEISQNAAPPASSPAQLANQAADKYGLPRQLVRRVMAAESGFRARAVSPKGAIGLMQLMPATAGALGADPNDPAQNVDAGARYLRQLLEKYHGALYHALAAYNAGPAAVDRYNGVPPYAETIGYISRIARDWKKVSSGESRPTSPPK